MEDYFATLLEDIRHERSLKALLSITDPDTIKRRTFTDHELSKKNLVTEKL